MLTGTFRSLVLNTWGLGLGLAIDSVCYSGIFSGVSDVG